MPSANPPAVPAIPMLERLHEASTPSAPWTAGDATAVLFAPLVAVLHFTAVTVLKFLDSEHSGNSPAA